MAAYSMHHDVSAIRKQFIHMCEESSVDKEVQAYFLGNSANDFTAEVLKNEIDKLPYKGRMMSVYNT